MVLVIFSLYLCVTVVSTLSAFCLQRCSKVQNKISSLSSLQSHLHPSHHTAFIVNIKEFSVLYQPREICGRLKKGDSLLRFFLFLFSHQYKKYAYAYTHTPFQNTKNVCTFSDSI